MSIQRPLAGIVVLVLLAALGCGSGAKRVHVWGQVEYDGKAIEEGQIILFPIDDTPGPSTGGPIKDGKYDILAKDGPFAGGSYRVEITGIRKGKPYYPSGAGKGFLVEVAENYLPDEYHRKSTLKMTVSASEADNQKDFKLVRPAP